VFFFFQAEDGIRDRNVTGVQTCALPISVGRPLRVLDVTVEFSGEGVRAAAIAVHQVKLGGLMALVPIIVAGVSDESSVGRNGGRSEERRVGKECGWGGGSGV